LQATPALSKEVNEARKKQEAGLSSSSAAAASSSSAPYHRPTGNHIHDVSISSSRPSFATGGTSGGAPPSWVQPYSSNPSSSAYPLSSATSWSPASSPPVPAPGDMLNSHARPHMQLIAAAGASPGLPGYSSRSPSFASPPAAAAAGSSFSSSNDHWSQISSDTATAVASSSSSSISKHSHNSVHSSPPPHAAEAMGLPWFQHEDVAARPHGNGRFNPNHSMAPGHHFPFPTHTPALLHNFHPQPQGGSESSVGSRSGSGGILFGQPGTPGNVDPTFSAMASVDEYGRHSQQFQNQQPPTAEPSTNVSTSPHWGFDATAAAAAAAAAGPPSSNSSAVQSVADANAIAVAISRLHLPSNGPSTWRP
jgi:hypothetical protein